MSKWYAVKAISVNEYLVEVEDNETEENAIDYAQEVMFSSQVDEFECEPFNGDPDMAIHHFTEVLPIPEGH